MNLKLSPIRTFKFYLCEFHIKLYISALMTVYFNHSNLHTHADFFFCQDQQFLINNPALSTLVKT
jgi:hypothetical protein